MSDAAGGTGSGRDDGSSGGSGGSSGGGGTSTVERAITAISVAFTLVLLGVVLWQSVTAPADVRPQASVTEVETGPNGRLEVTVELVNQGSVGLASATVEVGCTQPPTELVFQHVPASGRRQGTVVCPSGTTGPDVTVTGWQEA